MRPRPSASAALLLLTLAACASHREIVPEGARPPVVRRVFGPTLRGTSFPIGAAGWVTCRHVLPERPHVLQLEQDDLPVWAFVQGDDARPAGDWVLVESERHDLGMQLGADPELGDELFLVGFPKTEIESERATIVRTRVVGERDAETGCYSLEMDDETELSGMSGAPIVKWNDGARDYVVVGIYFGRQVSSFDMWSLFRVERTQLLCLPLPPELRAAAAASGRR